MPSAKPKSYGQGPQGYFQRVLGEGAKPFQPQVHTNRLLGVQVTATAQPLSANKISSVSFNYQNRLDQSESMGDVSNIDPSVNQQTGLEQARQYPANDIHSEHRSGTVSPEGDLVKEVQAGTVQNRQEEITVLSWLERMQARQPVLVQDEPVQHSEHVQEDISKETNQATFAQPETRVSEKASHKELTDQATTLAPIPSKVSKMPSKVIAAKNENKTTTEKVEAPISQSINIALPDGPLPNVSRITKSDIPSKSTDQVATVQQTSAAKINQLHQSEQTHSRVKQDPIVHQTPKAEVQLKQKKPASRTVTKPNTVSQGTRISRLKQALNTRPKGRTASSTHEPHASQTKQEPVISQTQRTQPQVQQNITIVNPPASSNQSAAFWERNYMNRSGPRNFR